MEKTYDAIFIGSSLTSLGAAAMLARKRRSILVLNATDTLGLLSAFPSFNFSLGPLLFSGFEERGAMEGFFSELGLSVPALKKQGLLYRKNNPTLQLALPRHRIDLQPQPEEYIDELKREFGGQLKEIKSFLQEVEAQGAVFYPYQGQFNQAEIQGLGDRFHVWRERIRFLLAVRRAKSISALSFLAPFGFRPNFIEYLNLQALFTFQKDLAACSSYELVRLVSALQKGAIRMIGGYTTLVQFFLKQIKEDGGEIIQGKGILKIEMKGREVSAVQLEGGSLLPCRNLVVVESTPQRFFNFYFTLKKESVPSPMKEGLVMTWGGPAPAGVEDILVVRLSLLEEEAPFSPDVRGLVVSLLLRPGVEMTESAVMSLTVKTLERLHWLIPFSKSEIQEVGNDLQKNEGAPFLPPTAHDWRAGAREISNETLRYLRPEEAKNVLMVKNDLSEQWTPGSDFLAAGVLARLVQEGR